PEPHAAAVPRKGDGEKGVRTNFPERAASKSAPVPDFGIRLGGGAVGAAALVLLEVALAQADGLGRDLDELVVADELDRVLERELDGRREVDGLVLARGTDVGELLGLDRVHDEVVVAAVDADDHALV